MDCKSKAKATQVQILSSPTNRSIPSTYNVTLAQFEDTAKGKSSGAHSDADLKRTGRRNSAVSGSLPSIIIKGSGVTATRRSLKPGPSEGVILGSNPSSPANYRPFLQII